MKFIHTADIHLGSSLNLNLSREKIEERRLELRATFKNIVDFAVNNEVRAIILSGDVFDGERALKKDKEFFYNIVKNHPNIDFLYLRGNHDIKEGFFESYPNLKLFSDEWTYYAYGSVVISGIEMTSKNASSLYQTLNLKENDLNIVMLHGQVADTTGNGLISAIKLKDKYIDYLALGHIHSYSETKIDGRTRYTYSGCPEGRGFDECGEKGIVLLVADNGKISSTFIPMAKRKISSVKVSIAGLTSIFEVYSRIKNDFNLNKNDLYRIELIGEVDFDTEGIEGELSEYLKKDCYYASVKDKTHIKINLEKLKGDISLKGEFLREVLNSDLSEDDKNRIISLGLKALSGREI